jgi:hypothetical protein
MEEHRTPHRLVGLEDALRVLDCAGPVSNADLAHELGLHGLEVRLVMLQAHWHGLVRTTHRGDWAISDRGREALADGAAPPPFTEALKVARAALSGRRWRTRWRLAYLTSGGVPIVLGVLVCAAASAAVATNNVPILSPPPAQLAPHRHHHHHRRVRRVRTAARARPRVRGRHIERPAPSTRARIAYVRAPRRPEPVRRSEPRRASLPPPRLSGTRTAPSRSPVRPRHRTGKPRRTGRHRPLRTVRAR